MPRGAARVTTLGWVGAALGVFAAAVVYDLCFARYVAAAAARRAVAAASWSAATYAIGLIGFASVLRGSVWLALPQAVGLFVGTLLGVRRDASDAPA